MPLRVVAHLAGECAREVAPVRVSRHCGHRDRAVVDGGIAVVNTEIGVYVMLYSSTRPLARKVAAFRDFMIDVVKREWVG